MVKNLRLEKPNMTRIGSYFYSFDEQADIMLQKADDGTLAFSYPLDTTISREISSLEFDGESYWTMENISATPDLGTSDGFRIRRWVIENFVMVLQDTFSFATNATDTFESNAFTVDHYEGTLTSGAVENTTTFNVNFDTDVFSLLTPGTKMFIGPSTKGGFVGETESITVNSTVPASKQVTVSAPLTNGYLSGNTITFGKNLWVFNQNYQKITGVGALYKISSLDGSILSRTGPAGAFYNIRAATFHEVDSFTGSLTVYNKPYLVFIRTTNLLFIDPFDTNLVVELSAVQNNLSSDTTTVYSVFDMGIEGETIFRLQEDFNINGQDSSETTYNYQLATFKPFPTAIAITADPAILPADAGASNSTITATVTDQYALAYVTTPDATIQFSTTGGGGSLSDTGQIPLNSQGQATVTYTTGNVAGLVTISAVVTINA